MALTPQELETLADLLAEKLQHRLTFGAPVAQAATLRDRILTQAEQHERALAEKRAKKNSKL